MCYQRNDSIQSSSMHICSRCRIELTSMSRWSSDMHALIMTSEQDTQIDNQEVPDRCKECGSMFLYRRLAMDWFIIGEPAHL